MSDRNAIKSDATASDSTESRVQGGDGVEVAEEAGAAPGETDSYSSEEERGASPQKCFREQPSQSFRH